MKLKLRHHYFECSWRRLRVISHVLATHHMFTWVTFQSQRLNSYSISWRLWKGQTGGQWTRNAKNI